MCPTDPEDWKKIEKRFRNRWNVSHAVDALDRKHIVIRRTKKSGSEYFNYKAPGLLLPATFGFSRCRLQVPVGQWVFI